MATDHTAVAIDTNTSITTPASVEGELVLAPPRARLAQISSTEVIRVSLSAADAATLTAANSNVYPANQTHDIWLAGVSPGGRAPSVKPGGPTFVVATANAGTVSVVYRT